MCRKHWIRLYQFLLAFIILAFPTTTKADAVTSFHSDVNVSRDNVVSITETIIYDPQEVAHHGIYRFVPAQFKDSEGNTYYTKVAYLSVTDSKGQKVPIASKHNNGKELYLKIGDADTTFTTPQTYIIKYQISPLVIRTNADDRLILNITGQQWEIPIWQASMNLKFDSADIIDIRCFTGATYSTDQNCIASGSGSQASVITSKPLPASQGLTVDLRTHSGSVTTYLEPNRKIPLSTGEKAIWGLIGFNALVLLATGLRLAWGWLAEWRVRKNQTIIPQYEPPDNLKPAQLSIIESPKQDAADITATVIDLAVRGYLKIDQIQSKTWFRQANYRFTKLKPLDNLEPFELDLANALFSGRNSIELKDLKGSMSIAAAVQKMRKDLGSDLKTKGYFKRSATQNWAVLRVAVFSFGVMFLTIPLPMLINRDLAAVVPAWMGFIMASINFTLTYLKTGRTLAGNQEWARVTGFKWFLSVTEKDRLAFTDAPEKTPQLFSAMLPYAVALKVEKQWAKQFESIDVGQAVGGWYGGSNFNGAVFASSFTSDFSSNFSGAVSSSFAGASGGGGAGGGGGGGGGGGW